MSQLLLQRLTGHARRTPHAPVVRRVDVPDQPAVTCRELAVSVSVAAARIACVIHPGDAVLLVCPNEARFHVAFLAILAAGGRAFPVSPDSTPAELAAAAERAGARLAIGGETHLAGLNVPSRLPLPDLVTDREAKGTLRLVCRDTRAGGLLLQSSGTTGLPKIVFRNAASLDAVAEQMVEAIGIRSGDRVLVCLPLCHSYGLEHGLLAPVLAGACVHLCAGFDFPTVLAQLSDAGIDVFPGVPFMFEALARTDGGRALPSLRRAYSAGGPLPQSVYDGFRARTGVRVSQLYGATEVGSVTYGDPFAEAFDPAAVGRPMRGVSVRILDAADPNAVRPLPPGAEGQVAVRAASMLSGYVPDDSPPTAGGFFLTGDLGRLDARGNLTITGRTKLLIDVGGLKVNPLEVEAVLAQHPAVGRCVVVPFRVSDTVCRLKAVVTPRPGAAEPISPESLRRFARERLVPYKVPRVFEVRTTLPLSPTGKVLRHLVAA